MCAEYNGRRAGVLIGGTWNRVGADGLIERARSMSPSVKTSAAKLPTFQIAKLLHTVRGCVPENGVSVHTSVLKVNTGCTIRSHNYL
jgi:hypothetical protein